MVVKLELKDNGDIQIWVDDTKSVIYRQVKKLIIEELGSSRLFGSDMKRIELDLPAFVEHAWQKAGYNMNYGISVWHCERCSMGCLSSNEPLRLATVRDLDGYIMKDMGCTR